VTLKAARVNAGLTLKKAAEAASISEKTLSYWEKGHTSPRAEDLLLLCSIYNAPIEDIILPQKLSLT
ncbi:MAG: helix-turn-helix transcriptional regulator, partial [Oscillospiraceae bacterium]|nr:helix-turn-helix transcriptional regulator [Oscillospiraceae bacterium]